ncbi:hypothetical protein [Corynebacterium halotolerans]|uniref:Secreted protein n=1 Tax=Corynebacterium halotolerans YIM 70093 = DSM 44683 TaxID=1121362 RepID=M1NR60_9CORY|nr:hypothetical protein [Corynebacterium halotolerans]AGF71987.1 hypothetical protein A605_04905 [Corynebacterium halotolerans YIM 70093 = DSM 44683]
MTTFSIRQIAAAGAAAVTALALAACVPPNENPSDEKVNTATEYNGPYSPGDDSPEAITTGAGAPTTVSPVDGAATDAEVPGFINCVATPVQEPGTITLDCADASDQLIEIDWEDWGQQQATGTGTRQTPEGEQENVDVVLSTPIVSPQGLVFSEITVDGVPVTP